MTPNYWISSASGNWNDPSHWSHGDAPLATDDVGIIQTGTFTVSVTGAVAVNSILFDSAGATFAEMASGSIATTGNFEVDSGFASLSGVNSFGQIVLAGGTLQYSKGTALGGGQLEFTGGVLRSTGSATVSNFLDFPDQFGGQVTIDAKTGTTLAIGGGGFSIAAFETISRFNQDIVFNAPTGATANTGTIVWSDGGTVTGGSTFNVTVAGGTLRAGGQGIESLLFSNVHVDSGATIDLHGTPGVEMAQLTLDAGGTIENTAVKQAGIELQGGATVNGTITGNIAVGLGLGVVADFDSSQYYTGGTLISGDLFIGGADQVSLSGPIVVDNGFFIYASSWTGSATYGAISGNGVVEVKSGTLLFNHANSFSGGTALLGGTLALGNANGLGTVNGTGGGGVTFEDSAGDTRPVLLGTTTETIAGPLALEYNSEIAATTGTTLTLTKGSILVSSNFPGNQVSNIQFNDASHAGTVVFEAKAGLELNSGTTVDVTLAAGTLKAGDDALSELANGAAQFTIDAGTTLDLNGHDLTVSDNFSLPGAPFSLVNSSSAIANLTIEHQYNILSVPSGNLNVSLVDADMVAVNTAYTGSTTIDLNSIELLAPMGSNPTLAFQDFTGLLDGASGPVTGLPKAQTVTLNGSIDDEGTLGASVTQKAALMSNISGAGTFDLVGGGSAALAELGGDNSGFTGALIAVDVVVMVDQASGLGAGTFTAYDAGVIARQSIQLATPLSFHGDASISAANGTVATLNGALDFNTAIFLSGNYGHLSVSFGDTAHKGTVLLASSSFEEDTSASQPLFVNVNGGTLKAGNGTTLESLAAAATTFAIVSGATVDLNGFDLSLGAFNNQGTITSTASKATLTTTAWSTLGGIVTGNLALDVSQGLLTLAGSATYTGGTTVAIGATLQVGTGGSTGMLAHAVVDNGGLVFDHNVGQTFAGAISGLGGVVQENVGPLTLSGVNSYAGGTFIDNGAIAVTNAASLGTGNVALIGGSLIGAATTALSALTAAANTTTLNGNVEIAAAHGTTFSVRPSHLTLNGGTVIFGDSTHDGTVNFGATHTTASGTVSFEIADGQVNAAGSADVFAVGAMKIDAGAALNVNGLAASLSSLTGAGTLTNTQSGTAVVTLGGATNFSGTLAGAIAIAVNGTAVLSGNESFTGTATLDNHATLTIGGMWSEKLIFASGGRVNLTNPNSFSGTIGGFQAGDTVNLDNIAGASATHSWNAAANKLTITGGGHTDTLKFTPGLSAANFKIVGDGAGGTNVIYQASPQAPVPDALVFSSSNTAAQSSHSDTAIHDIADRGGPVPLSDVSHGFGATVHDELLVTLHRVDEHGDLWA